MQFHVGGMAYKTTKIIYLIYFYLFRGFKDGDLLAIGFSRVTNLVNSSPSVKMLKDPRICKEVFT